MTEERLVYTKYGTGNHILFAFHGFGQNKSFFQKWEKILGSTHTIYAFDLYYHGESSREYGKLTKAEWVKSVSKVISENKIEHFSIVAYSLGGRFALATAIELSEKIDDLILVAPDGIFLTVWFKLATRPLFRQVFKYVMVNPTRLDKWIRVNEKYRIVNRYITDFVKKEMGSAENRKRVYVSWNSFKTLGYSKSQLISSFQKKNFERGIILGSRDHIIKPKKILPIINEMGGFDVKITSKKHHQLLDEDVAHYILERFNLKS